MGSGQSVVHAFHIVRFILSAQLQPVIQSCKLLIFANVEDFLAFLCASDYYDDEKISQNKKSNVLKRIVNEDGTVTVYEPTIYQIIGKKS